jgi:hypothetical protein
MDWFLIKLTKYDDQIDENKSTINEMLLIWFRESSDWRYKVGEVKMIF